MADETIKKHRGRPPLSDEERELRRLETNKKQAERLKRNGYAAQKKYKATHKEENRVAVAKRSKDIRDKSYTARILMDNTAKSVIKNLCEQTGLSISALFIKALEDKYSVDIPRFSIDKNKKK